MRRDQPNPVRKSGDRNAETYGTPVQNTARLLAESIRLGRVTARFGAELKTIRSFAHVPRNVWAFCEEWGRVNLGVRPLYRRQGEKIDPEARDWPNHRVVDKIQAEDLVRVNVTYRNLLATGQYTDCSKRMMVSPQEPEQGLLNRWRAEIRFGEGAKEPRTAGDESQRT
jgi:hypothetical protein